jgi:hypothetical protein
VDVSVVKRLGLAAKKEGGTSSVCSLLWTAVHARPTELQALITVPQECDITNLLQLGQGGQIRDRKRDGLMDVQGQLAAY